nr:SpoIIE family protein phosphatase [Streptomyces sp. SCL15-6]
MGRHGKRRDGRGRHGTVAYRHPYAVPSRPAPAEVLNGLDRLAEDLESPFATCTYLTCRPASGTCEFASAGHLPPVVVRPRGTTELVDPPPGPPLGIGNSRFTTHRLALAARQQAPAVHRSRPGPTPSTTGSSASAASGSGSN